EVDDVAPAVIAAPAPRLDVEHVEVEVLRQPPAREQLVAAVDGEAADLVPLADGAQVDREVVGVRARRAPDARGEPDEQRAPARTRPRTHRRGAILYLLEPANGFVRGPTRRRRRARRDPGARAAAGPSSRAAPWAWVRRADRRSSPAREAAPRSRARTSS